MALTRRELLAGAAIGGGVLVAWTMLPRDYPEPLTPGRSEYAFDAWLKIAEDGVVTVAVPQLEMGQGVTTLLPQVIAMELGADWRQIAVEPAPVSSSYANIPLAARWAPLWMPRASGLADEPDDLIARRFAESARFSVTADGTSLAAYEQPCREAAAIARTMLAMAAADRWDVDFEQCQAKGGFITHGDKRLSFAELAAEASTYDPPDPPPLLPEPPADTLIPADDESITAFPRLDLPSKVDGTYLFAGDVRLPNMVFAAIRHGPIDKSELNEFNNFSARGIRGLVSLIEGKRWIAAAATDWWTAERALDAIKPRFSVDYLVDSDAIEDRMHTALREGEATRIATRGNGDSGMGTADVALRYEVAPALHATLETASATARLEDGRLELWIATQAPEYAREAAARALDMSVADVVLYPMPAGGSFDRRLEHDHAIEVALIAREVARPVQLVWSRWQEHLMDRPRAPAKLLVTANTRKEGQGEIEAMRMRIATPPSAAEFGQRLFENKVSWAAVRDTAGVADPLACEGAMPIYGIPNVAVDHVPVEIGLPTGRMRGNAHSYTAFAIESFIDEMASRSEREPLSYRIEMLGSDLRMVECLQRAARLAEWGGGGENSGQGLACHRIGDNAQGGRIACIATARAGEGGVRVASLHVAVDIGRIINVDIARQQIEGGLIFGLAQAMGGTTRYSQGLPHAQRLADLNLPLLADSPEMEIEFITSTAEPADPGELGVAVAAPAIANALFSATGLRLRTLPLLSDGL